MVKQRTLNRVVKASGIGLHSGQKVMINFIPHTVDGGIVFRRIDLDPPVDIPANALLIQEAFMCSNLVTGDIKVGTIEHVMSAIAGLGIDNLIVEVSASEVPIMDGSAGPFIYLLMQGGLREQDAPKKFIKILKPVEALIDDKKQYSARIMAFSLTLRLILIILHLPKSISLQPSIFLLKRLCMRSVRHELWFYERLGLSQSK